jgi:predicted RNase H-like HicB family nuclease
MFIAECPAIPGCVSQGGTEAAAGKNIHEAIRECLAVRAEKGMPLTVPTRQ